MSDANRRLKRYRIATHTDGPAVCQGRVAIRLASDDSQAEFARLLVLAFVCRKEVRAQQAFIRETIAAGDHQTVRKEWGELTNLLLENRMLSRRLTAVFENQRAP